MILRDYQHRACSDVIDAWKGGTQAVLLVAPTGAGKTVMGKALVEWAYRSNKRVLWVAHRDELIDQAARAIGGDASSNPYPAVKVASIQTMVARDWYRPKADLLVLDEAHHYAAEQWSGIRDMYPFARTLGLTATPERSDGKPLGDLFQSMVVAAHYPELVAQGHIVPCRVFRPGENLDTNLAQHPLEAYRKYGDGRTGFVYAGSVPLAYEWAQELTAGGVPAACIEANTDTDERRDILQRFRDGKLKLLTNVYTLTEGVDVPHASLIIIGRGIGHVTPYLQMAGRGLRACAGKKDAVLVDLPGVSHRFGVPTERREYSLDGNGIRRVSKDTVRCCMRCGWCWEGAPACPQCGFKLELFAERQSAPKIYSLELEEVFAGGDTPQPAKDAELKRLREVARLRGYGAEWVAREYRTLFGAPPTGIPEEEMRIALQRWEEIAKRKSYKPGWAKWQYKVAFGRWPR